MAIVDLLAKEVAPFFGVPEALLSDRGTNLLMRDVCSALGIAILNTTANHPQYNGMVGRFILTLKAMLRKHANCYSKHWDQYLAGHSETPPPHPETTGEKPLHGLLLTY